MKVIADLHIHSRYSMATSKLGTPEYLDLWARKKGISLVGTGDFTHPAWREELKEKLELEKGARDREIQKALEKEGNKLKAEAETAAAKQIETTRRDNESMAQQIKELEAKIDNVSNESLMLFKLKVDQLQKIYQECQEAATETPDPDKTKAALVQIMEALIRQEA